MRFEFARQAVVEGITRNAWTKQQAPAFEAIADELRLVSSYRFKRSDDHPGYPVVTRFPQRSKIALSKAGLNNFAETFQTDGVSGTS
jgi:hypothetical protein